MNGTDLSSLRQEEEEVSPVSRIRSSFSLSLSVLLEERIRMNPNFISDSGAVPHSLSFICTYFLSPRPQCCPLKYQFSTILYSFPQRGYFQRVFLRLWVFSALLVSSVLLVVCDRWRWQWVSEMSNGVCFDPNNTLPSHLPPLLFIDMWFEQFFFRGR